MPTSKGKIYTERFIFCILYYRFRVKTSNGKLEFKMITSQEKKHSTKNIFDTMFDRYF
jgi:hypothetical protein